MFGGEHKLYGCSLALFSSVRIF